MKEMIKAAKKLIEKNNIKIISSRENILLYEVGLNIVKISRKPGRTLVTCSCRHHARFCNSPTICKHKLAIFKLMMTDPLFKT